MDMNPPASATAAGEALSARDAGYDEFGALEENAEEAGLPWGGPPAVARRFVDVGGGRRVSAIVWGMAPAEAVFLHGGAQNAHTWDTVALALGRPLVAIDMPGHGQSDWRVDHDYAVPGMADDVAEVCRELAPQASILVGIGLGAPVSLLTADRLGRSTLRVVMVDSASGARPPGGERRQTQAGAKVAEFTAHHRFASFDEMLQRTVQFNGGRSQQSLRRGARHNARQLPDGSWEWRWDPDQRAERDFAFDALAEALDRLAGPVLLVRGGQSDIVTDDAVALFRERHPDTRLVTIDRAGHGVQGDRPVELAEALRSFWPQRD
jgi:pimeloyl-ACP methyl ester carboxylesterase